MSSVKLDSLNVYYQNVRGLRTKTHLFYCNLMNSCYDIIILTETWLNSGVSSLELFNDRYVVYRRDREVSDFHCTKEGGSVLIAVLKSLKSIRNKSLESGCEDIWVTVEIGDHNKYHQILFLWDLSSSTSSKNNFEAFH
ncbi:unnamed protein product [Euphydryas editha]|uniref:Uncharacterized protein n=1 Tax=Euphydryas editha TaxID=104508 RepID=A0AAU9VFN4_EUPED|nr:unnamed protein product [Euphydryas editha]